MKTIVIIPAYREEGRVGPVVAAVKKYGMPVLVVDDGSPDGTGAEAAGAGANVIRLDPNRGKGAALQAGFAEARRLGYDAAVTLDADGQHDPAYIPAIVAALERRADLVIGRRLKDVRSMPPQRVFSNFFSSALVSLVAGVYIGDSQTGYRGLRLDALDKMVLVRKGFDFESEILLKAGRAGLRVKHVTVPTIYGTEKSKYRPLRDSLEFFRVICADLWSRLER